MSLWFINFSRVSVSIEQNVLDTLLLADRKQEVRVIEMNAQCPDCAVINAGTEPTTPAIGIFELAKSFHVFVEEFIAYFPRDVEVVPLN